MSAPRCLRCAADTSRHTTIVRHQSSTVARDWTRTVEPPTRSLYRPRHYATVADEEERPRMAKAAGGPVIERIPSTVPEKIDISPSPKRGLTPVASTIGHGVGKNLEDTPVKRRSTTTYPPNVLAAYRTPVRHPFTHGNPVASLQLRSYSARNLEFFADFALRVATYLKLPATGAVPLPKRIERWTVLKDSFIHKKAQENFERITLKRLITVYDGHPDVVEVWLACLRKWQFYGVGMKANVWGYSSLDVAKEMDKTAEQVEQELSEKLANFGWANSAAPGKSIQDMLVKRGRDVVGSSETRVRHEIADAPNVFL